ncbi:CASP-like protein 4D1 [Capsicum annuum]|uniref:CASP-like protein n=1 Tax=Capsicum annuum TaxID=4072 RepID=A0A2G2ZG68_CAPAN|nr:cASP-like protein PIMP1 isoform X1 [Capsicum annuum]ABC79684.1 PIMP1 protein [Capsicum annuum]PHT80901.1 CASP-like protein 4D1 [Capsicum annuum]
MTPPPTTTVPPYVSLIVRILTLICLLISFIVIATNNQTVSTVAGDVKIKFKDFYAYRYLIATVIIGMAYTLLQIAFSISLLTTGNRIGGEGFLLFDFYGDKFISYFLVTGAAASFGMTQDLKQLEGSDNYSKFLNTSNAAASLCLIGFFFAVASSIFSSYNLPKRI